MSKPEPLLALRYLACELGYFYFCEGVIWWLVMRSHQVLMEITPDQQYQWGYILVYNVSPNGHESTVTFEETKKNFFGQEKFIHKG